MVPVESISGTVCLTVPRPSPRPSRRRAPLAARAPLPLTPATVVWQAHELMGDPDYEIRSGTARHAK